MHFDSRHWSVLLLLDLSAALYTFDYNINLPDYV